MNGSLSVLNCGRGDLYIQFEKGDRDGMERAREVIQDMLKRGYLLFVQMKDGTLRKVQRFDGRQYAYVLSTGKDSPKPSSSRQMFRRPLRKTKAYGVAPTAGG